MIYLVEDDDNIRKLVCYALSREGFEVQGYASPKEFWEGMSAGLPGLILLDIMLPEEDGLSILEKLKNQAGTDQIPVIMLTAKGSEFDKVTGLDKGADDYVSKPFGTMELIARVRAVLRRFEKIQEKKVYKVGELYNHAGREEIREAMETGKGMSTRYSTTLMKKTVNYALRLSDNSVLRVSTEQYTVIAILLGLLQPMLVILFAAMLLTMVISSRVSRAIIGPVNRLDLEIPENNDTYEELTPLLRKIADQKQTIEEQLEDARKKQKEFELVTENMSEGFLVIDQDAKLLAYNSAASKLLTIAPALPGGAGAGNSSVSGGHSITSSVLLYCRAREFREAISDALSGKRAENIMLREEHSYNLIANPVFEDGAVIGAVVVMLDITESEKRNTLRREFTANVSHELKTPLTSISGFAELMKEGDVSKEHVIDFSGSIYDEAQRLITLVNDIIKLSELDGQSIAFENETVDLYGLSEEVIGRLENEAARKSITFHLIGGRAEITGARKILDEMLYNLCDNAVKYNKPDGTVDVIVNQDRESVQVIVRDTGIGIPAAHRDRVFERFYRVDKSHSKKVGGTGLGLAIVKHGAMYHHAKISMESAVDVGTTVALTFPAGKI